MPFARFSNAQQRAIDFFSGFGSESPGHLLPVFALSQIPFAHVVVEGDVEIVQEQQMIPLIFFQPVQKSGLFFCGPPEATGFVLSLLLCVFQQFIVSCFQTLQFFQLVYCQQLIPLEIERIIEIDDEVVTAQSPPESSAIEHKSIETAQAKRVPPERIVLKALIKSFPCRLKDEGTVLSSCSDSAESLRQKSRPFLSHSKSKNSVELTLFCIAATKILALNHL